MTHREAIGVDVGGTTIKFGIVRDDGTVRGHHALPTEAERGPEGVLDRIARGIGTLLETPHHSISGIGLGVPGVINNSGEVCYPPNFPGWEVVPVADRLGAILGTELPIAVENDANAAAFAEAHAGSGHGAGSFLYITLGTGVGGCIIHGGRIWRGEAGGAGEVGHISVDMNGHPCNCGSRGCVEAYIGQRYMTAIAAERLRTNAGSRLHLMMAHGAALSPELIDRAADAGDAFARRFLEEMGEILGAALASALNMLDFHLVIAGGGMARSAWLLDAAHCSMRSRVLRSIGNRAELRTARFGNDAGIIGAGLMTLIEF
ncbi:MAG: ROK family protein [Bacteroidetes bacterium]|nr:ROK family protein [Bacteroidota bacterium]